MSAARKAEMPRDVTDRCRQIGTAGRAPAAGPGQGGGPGQGDFSGQGDFPGRGDGPPVRDDGPRAEPVGSEAAEDESPYSECISASAGPLQVEALIDRPGWREIDLDGLLRRSLEAVAGLGVVSRPEAAVALSLRFTDDAAMRALNARFRRRDKPTNVLSFPSGEAEKGFLGDIALGYETVAAEASMRGVGVETHAVHLVIHGLLHLLGYDHESDRDAEIMEALETRAMGAIGLPDPYGSEKRG